MLGGIAGQGGFDSKGKTSYIAGTETTNDTGTPATVVSVSGSGYIQGISAGASISAVWIWLTIDGVAKATTLQVTNGSSNIALSLNVRFNSSFYVKVAGNNGNLALCQVSYLLD